MMHRAKDLLVNRRTDKFFIFPTQSKQHTPLKTTFIKSQTVFKTDSAYNSARYDMCLKRLDLGSV